MVELARFRQMTDLQRKGWTVDDECRSLHRRDDTGYPGHDAHGPSYMRSPDDFMIYGIANGKELDVPEQAVTPELSGLLTRLRAKGDSDSLMAVDTLLKMANGIALGLEHIAANADADRSTSYTLLSLQQSVTIDTNKPM